MKDYRKNMRLALVCFLLVVVLNFFLPRLLPGDPVAYLTGLFRAGYDARTGGIL